MTNGQPEDINNRTIKELILYKTDRTLAILGIVILGGWAMSINAPEAAMAAIAGLVGYVGGRTGK